MTLSLGSAVLDAIETKKVGGDLSEGIIRSVVEGYAAGEVPDYQMSSLLMAIFIQGMDYEETLALTRVMAESGKTYSFPGCVDKHSTGGVGDKVSLTALPIAAACGAPGCQALGAGARHDRRHHRQAGVYPRRLFRPLRGAFRAPGRRGRARHNRGRGSRTRGQGDLRPPRHNRHH